MQLVLACARARLNPAAAAEVALAAGQSLDWLKAADLASSHRLSPVLISSLQQHATASLPEDVRLSLLERFRAQAVRNFELTRELLEILSLLQKSGVNALALKGPVLSRHLYGDLFLREFLDLDILVRPGDAWTVMKLISAKGFEPHFILTPRQFARFQRGRYDIGLFHPAKRVLVELHWALISPGYSFSPTVQMVWESVQSISIAGRSIKTLSSENQLLCSCLQQAKHNWWRLGWVMDMAGLIRQSPAMDWRQIQNRAGSFGTARMIRVSLRLVQQIFEVTLPESITEWIREDVYSIKIAEQILKHFLLVDITAEQPPRRDPLLRACMESFTDRVFYWFDNALRPTPLEWALLPLPHSLYALYYPIRMGRLVCKYTVGRMLARRTALQASSEML